MWQERSKWRSSRWSHRGKAARLDHAALQTTVRILLIRLRKNTNARSSRLVVYTLGQQYSKNQAAVTTLTGPYLCGESHWQLWASQETQVEGK